jgi:perosamine synthetase
MDAICAIAARHGLVGIEDAAEAHGAEYRERRVGSLGRCGVLRFYGNKIITSGEGGMITTDEQAVYTTAKQLRDHAMSAERRYRHDEVGYSYRMTNLQAAHGVAQFERIDDLIARRRQIISGYREDLGNRTKLHLNRSGPWTRTVNWLVCLEAEAFGAASRPFFYPLSDMPMYRSKAAAPVAHRVSRVGMYRPLFVDLSRDDVRHICMQLELSLNDLQRR